MKAMLSAVVPAYNEEIMVPRAARVIGQVLRDAEIDYEIVFVNDGSKDGTWERIETESRENPAVRGVCFSRNFGKEAAIMAGLAAAKGDCVVVLDCDLQHPPEKIVEMYRLWQQGYEVVEGQKSSRGKESAAHAWAARSFYSIISAAVGFDMSKASDFKLLDRKAVNVLLNMRESNAFFRALSSWIGFRTAVVPFDVQEREAGVSKWSTKALVKYAVSNITSFSTLPMQLITLLGVVVFVVSCVLGGIALVQKFTGRALGGFTTVILILLFSGLSGIFCLLLIAVRLCRILLFFYFICIFQDFSIHVNIFS